MFLCLLSFPTDPVSSPPCGDLFNPLSSFLDLYPPRVEGTSCLLLEGATQNKIHTYSGLTLLQDQ